MNPHRICSCNVPRNLLCYACIAKSGRGRREGERGKDKEKKREKIRVLGVVARFIPNFYASLLSRPPSLTVLSMRITVTSFQR